MLPLVPLLGKLSRRSCIKGLSRARVGRYPFASSFASYCTKVEPPSDLPAAQIPPTDSLPPTSVFYDYAVLSKAKLSSFVLATMVVGYVLAPPPMNLPVLVTACVGTGLAIMSANSYNQCVEVDKDRKMIRTRNRPVVTGKISQRAAMTFSITTGTIGCSMLYFLVNPVAGSLAAANIGGYVLYTYLKPRSWYNTWVGACVGAVPPVIGWASATGEISMPQPWVLAFFMLVWQIPHFLSLSYLHSEDYAADYKMLVNVHPTYVGPFSNSFCLLLLPVTFLSIQTGLVVKSFLFPSLVTTACFMASVYYFTSNPSKSTSKVAFFGSLVFLGVFLILLVLFKGDNVLKWPFAKEEAEAEKLEEMNE